MANMVFYESWLETVDAFEKMFGTDFAKETIYALVYLSIRGEVKTENDLILGNCMGSGTTGVACMNTWRKFIGIELEPQYFEIAKNRIQNVQNLNKFLRPSE